MMGIYQLVLTVWIYIWTSSGSVRGQVSLTLAGALPVDEGNSITLTCTYTGTEPVALFLWNYVVGDVGGTDDIPKGYIIPSGCTEFNVNETKYSFSCPSNAQVTWTIKNIDRYNDGDKWACSASAPSAIYSNAVSIGVRVPIQSLTMILPNSDATLNVVENTNLVFSCRTDGGLPVADITWFKDNGTSGTTSDDIKIQQNISVSQTSDNGLYVRTSTLRLYPLRSDGNTRIYCSAKNSEDQTPLISARKPLLNVLYAPSKPTIHYNTISGLPITVDPFDVVAGDSLPVACRADGEPEPNYTWQFDNTQLTGQSVVLSSIYKAMVDTTIKCIASNELKETGSTATVTMNIMYPPDIPNIRLKYGSGTYTSVSHTFSVLEGAAFVLDCQGSSKPNPSYQWLGSGGQSSSETHVSADTATRDGINTYTCEVTNLMNRTYGSPSKQEGTNSTTVTANILYVPMILPMFNQSAEEGKPFRFNCPYTPGNPKNTTVKWTRAVDNDKWNSEMLEIVNVTKDDKTKYICSVENTMEPTNHSPVTDPKSGHFYLDVKYKASIEEFIVEDHISNEVTVDEFTSPTLVCNVDSNPAADIKVLFQNQTLADNPSALQLKHQLSNVSCGDIGVYTCAGGNYLNTQAPSTLDIILLVKCRPQPYGDIAYTVYSAQRSTAILRLSVLAYPVSPPSIVWKKDETELKNNAKLMMTLHFEKRNESYIDIYQLYLIIFNVSVLDYGQYTVQIRNDAGVMKQTFILKAQEIVDPPGVNVGMIVGTFIGGAVFAELVTLAVIFLLRRNRATDGRNGGNNQSNDSNKTDTIKPIEDESHHNIERDEQMNDQSKSEATYYNEERVPEYQMLNQQHRDFTTYTSLQSGNNDRTEDHTSGENKAYENLKLQVLEQE